MVKNIIDQGIDRLVGTEDCFHLTKFLFALFNDIRIGVVSHNVILIIDQMEGVLVEFQVNHTALIVDGSGRAIFNCLSHIIDVDVITEDLSCTAVFCGDRCSGESNVGRIRKRVSYNAGSADNGFRLDFAVALLLDHNLLIETILPTMRFICHHDNVPAFRKSFVAFLKLLHSRENNAVCLPVCKQFFQVFATFGVLRCLPEKVLAAGELPVKLVIQIVAVGDDNDGRAFQCFLQIMSIEDHRQRLSAALCMPENAALAISYGCVFCRLNRLFDCEILMIPGEYLESILSIHIKADEVFHDVKEAGLLKQPYKECVK